jgi:hypothetical protein
VGEYLRLAVDSTFPVAQLAADRRILSTTAADPAALHAEPLAAGLAAAEGQADLLLGRSASRRR